MGNQGMGGPGGRNPFGGQMSEEEKKKARERRQEECKIVNIRIKTFIIDSQRLNSSLFLIISRY
jgi:hypothetical protein